MRRNDDSRDYSRRARHLEGIRDVDTRDYELLRKFMTDHGKILPCRTTGVHPKLQRKVKRAIRRARNMGILP